MKLKVHLETRDCSEDSDIVVFMGLKESIDEDGPRGHETVDTRA
jgi:hypothetical protein